MDTIRSPLSVRTAAGDAQRGGMGPVEYREFAGGHDLGEEELMQLVRWWLGA
jgi:predicted esterase